MQQRYNGDVKALDTAESSVTFAKNCSSSNNDKLSRSEVNCKNVKSSRNDEVLKAKGGIQYESNPHAHNQVVKMKNNDSGAMESLSACSTDLHSQFMTWLEAKKQNLLTGVVDNSNVSAEVIASQPEVESSNFSDTQSFDVMKCDDAVDNASGANSDDFDEFKDAIEDDVDDTPRATCDDANIIEQKQDDLTNVPLFIFEAEEDKHDQVTAATNDDTLLPLTIATSAENEQIDEKSDGSGSVIEAKFTLTSSLPLQIVTTKTLSTSSTSLESAKLPARHSKGPAPPPPGQFYDKDKKKYFKETEL